MTLYNIFTCTGGFTVTKWTDDFEVEASYVVNIAKSICTCPSRRIPCKHIELVHMAANEHAPRVDTYWFYNPDTAGWIWIVPHDIVVTHTTSTQSITRSWRRI